MDLEREIKRLRVRTALLTAFVTIGVLLFGGSKLLEYIESRQLVVYPTGDGVGLGTTSGDGPFVITHVVAYGNGEGDKRWAALREPMVVMDSEGGIIEFSRLQWRDIRNKPATAPKGDRMVAVYFKPELTKRKE